jgi:hypothetical protein
MLPKKQPWIVSDLLLAINKVIHKEENCGLQYFASGGLDAM